MRPSPRFFCALPLLAQCGRALAPPRLLSRPRQALSTSEAAASSPATVVAKPEVLKDTLAALVASTGRGRSATDAQRLEIDAAISSLELLCPFAAPARSPLVEGLWTVQYTDAPPPSNGKLGPFGGVAQQYVGLDGAYENILRVPPLLVDEGKTEWLGAVLKADWTEWDGTLLEDTRKGKGWKENKVGGTVETVEEGIEGKAEEQPSSFLGGLASIFAPKSPSSDIGGRKDYGATSWIVTFRTLTIQLLGFDLFTQTFSAGTQRVWRTTYVDEDTRIVRAGRTGRTEDELVFYMTRAKDGDVV